MNCLLLDLPKTTRHYTEHLFKAADELPRITITDLKGILQLYTSGV